jgi:integrase/antitoxin (DNA-binding transcriptional repressor) of toxin-antitoxin stability system
MAKIVNLFPSQPTSQLARDAAQAGKAHRPSNVDREFPLYLEQRSNGVFYFKRKIPAALVCEFEGQRQIWKSLKTTDFTVATRELAKEVAAFELRVTTVHLRRASQGLPVVVTAQGRTLSADMIPVLVQRYYIHMLDREEEELRAMRPISIATLQQRRTEVDEMLQYYQTALICSDYSAVEETAAQLLAGEGLSKRINSPVYKDFCEKLLSIEVDILREQRARLDGNKKPTPDMPLPVCLQPTLADYLAVWTQAKVRPPKTVETTTRMVRVWDELMGDTPAASITYALAVEFRDKLINMQLSSETIQNRLGLLRAVVNCYYQEKRIRGLDNPFDKIPMKDKGQRTRAEKDRRAFEISELNKIYQALVVARPFIKGQAREAGYWTALMGPFAGARIEELAQLRLADIEIINGVWTLRICNLDTETQELKNENSFRRVPIHQELIKLGFLGYLCEQKRAGEHRVFPTLKCDNKYNRWANALGKWFGRFLNKQGLTSTQLDYHSFRYNFKQRLTQCGVGLEIRDALCGHWLTKERGNKPYMKGANQQYDFLSLCNAIEALRYDELDLSALYVSSPYENVDIRLFVL